MFIPRLITDRLLNDLLHSGKVIVLYGPRQSGKTTLSGKIMELANLKTLRVNADQAKYIDVLSSKDLLKLRQLIHGSQMLFVDEAQRVPEIGINLKIIHDEIPDLKVLVTGSSSFLLSDRITESLTGRKKVFTLLPVSIGELSAVFSPFELNDRLEQFLIYGLYPEVLNLSGNDEREEYLSEISTSYLYKDILELENIKYPYKVRDLLRLLAFQTGSEVNFHELSKNLGLNRETVERYVYLLEQSFVIFRVTAYSKNLRKEIRKSQKIYFYDNGIRNILINNLMPLQLRNDTGALWENFVVAERLKKHLYERRNVNLYFWRTYGGAEIDLIEERAGKLTAFEIKYNKAKTKPPLTWSENYPSEFHCITKNNFQDYLA